jgi:hypothetical protein
MAPRVTDYFATAIMIAWRWHRPLLVRLHEDVMQECHLLALEAQVRRYIIVKHGRRRRKYGNGHRMGLKSFTHACNAKFYVFHKQYYSF